METETVKTVKHTELPWIVSPYGYPFEKHCPALIWSQKTINGNQKHIANVLDRIPYQGMNEVGFHLISVEEKNANAEFIVRACNSHYELLEALKETEQLHIDISTYAKNEALYLDKIGRLEQVIDQLTREADYREMNLKELQEKYDALTTYINERKTELSQPYHSEHSNASRPID